MHHELHARRFPDRIARAPTFASALSSKWVATSDSKSIRQARESSADYGPVCSGRPRRSHAAALVAFAALLLVVAPHSAAAASGFQRDDTPLPAGVTHASTAAASHGNGSGAFFRMVVGLAIVLALIYVVYRVLKRFSNREATVRDVGGMSIVATTQLAPARALHLLRVGDELVLVGSAEHGVTPIRVYSAEESRRLEADSAAPPRSLAPAAFRTDEQPGGFVSNMLEELRRRTVRR